MPPVSPETAAAQSDGDIGTDHVRAIAKVMRKIPHAVDNDAVADAETVLANLARSGTPEDVEQAGHRLLAYLNPDGNLGDDRDRKRRRGISIGRQDTELMSRISGELDPVARAMLDPILAKWARPGMNNPDDPDSRPATAKTPRSIVTCWRRRPPAIPAPQRSAITMRSAQCSGRCSSRGCSAGTGVYLPR